MFRVRLEVRVSDGDQSSPVSWDEANLPLERAASLITLGDGLCAIGQFRDGKRAGQFSIHNFLLRAAIEADDEVDNEADGTVDDGANDEAVGAAAPAGGADSAPMVVMMRAGVYRRHAWYMRVHRDGAGRPHQVDLPSPIDADWEWWPNIDEIRSRLIDEPVWASAVGATFDERCRVVAVALESARLTRIDAR